MSSNFDVSQLSDDELFQKLEAIRNGRKNYNVRTRSKKKDQDPIMKELQNLPADILMKLLAELGESNIPPTDEVEEDIEDFDDEE
jgi:hypothetical protein